MKRRLVSVLKAGVLVWLCLSLWKLWADSSARWVPDYAMEMLPTITSVEELSQEELDFFFAQTGLSLLGLLALEEDGKLDQLELYQRAFFLDWEMVSPEDATQYTIPFSTLPVHCFRNSILSWEEYVLDSEGNRGAYLPLVPLEEGDILLTPNSRAFGWRQGHSALVVGEGVTLESVVLGQNSTFQSLWKWQGFPSVIVLRVRDPEIAAKAVEYALDYLHDVPYALDVGVLSAKFLPLGEEVKGTQCSHLVWQAYQWAGGLDLDATGTGLVTPQDIAPSQDLDVVQIWGVNPEKMWS